MKARGLVLLLAAAVVVPEPGTAQHAEDVAVLRAVLRSARGIVFEVRGRPHQVALRMETREGYRVGGTLAEEAAGEGWVDYSCEPRSGEPGCQIRRQLAAIEIGEPQMDRGQATVSLAIIGLQRRPNSGFFADVLVRLGRVEGEWVVVSHQVLGIT